jgi:hypothetical protein
MGDTSEELSALRPPRYVVLEAQRSAGPVKRKPEDPTPQDSKRQAMAKAWDQTIGGSSANGGSPSIGIGARGPQPAPKAKPPPAPLPKQLPPAPAPGAPAPGPSAGTAPPAPAADESVDNLQCLLKAFGS